MISFKRLLITSFLYIFIISSTTKAMQFFHPENLLINMNVFTRLTENTENTISANARLAEALSQLAQIFKNNCTIYKNNIEDQTSRNALAQQFKKLFQPYQAMEKIPKEAVTEITKKSYMLDILGQARLFCKTIPFLVQSAQKKAKINGDELKKSAIAFGQYAEKLQSAIENFTCAATPTKDSDQDINDLIKIMIIQEIDLAAKHCTQFTQLCEILDACAQQLRNELEKSFNDHLDNCLQLLKDNFGIK